jgi:acyl-CoA reductase-like NAD-dependent aldehyde dehydrogenase
MTGVVAPSLDSARQLVTHPGVDMLCITGGAELVRDAFGTGKRVIAAGPGMPISVVDDTADVRWAAAEILKGAIFDNTILCIGEKAVVAADGVYRPLLDAFAELPAHVLSEDETERVYRAVIDDDGKGHRRTRREFVGRDAEVLLAAAGISSRKPVGLLVAPVEREHPLFWMEQFCPFLPVVRRTAGKKRMPTAGIVDSQSAKTRASASEMAGIGSPGAVGSKADSIAYGDSTQADCTKS